MAGKPTRSTVDGAPPLLRDYVTARRASRSPSPASGRCNADRGPSTGSRQTSVQSTVELLTRRS